jgi:hypothetical protein
MPGPDEQRSLIESEIARRLEERFAALREEFERLRRESDGRWAGFASRFEQRISGIVPAELLGPAGEAPRERGRLPIEEARELDGAPNQVEILRRLLDLCRRHASRAALLVSRGSSFSVWKAVGLPGGAEAETSVRRVSLPAESGALPRVSQGVPSRLPAGNDVSRRLACSDAVAAVLIPMAIGEKISGALYADAAPGEEERLDPETLAMLVFLAGVLIERVAVRKLRPAPALAAIENAPSPSPALDDYDTQVAGLWKEAPSPAEEAARSLAGPLAPRDDGERQAEARRFAQLLVSEIKLYNERAVEEGRAQGNLYRRLKQEIDLSRQVYEERIPESVRAGNDFLHEELVRILADGRAEALGI